VRVTKRKKDLFRFFIPTKDHLAEFSEKKNGWCGDPFHLKFWVNGPDCSEIVLNDLERRDSPYFAFFSPNSRNFQADYITVVKDRAIMSVKYCLLVSVFDS